MEGRERVSDWPWMGKKGLELQWLLKNCVVPTSTTPA